MLLEESLSMADPDRIARDVDVMQLQQVQTGSTYSLKEMLQFLHLLCGSIVPCALAHITSGL